MNNILDLNLKFLAQSYISHIVEKHDCGWFDGGCYTFAYLIKSLFPDQCELFHISRCSDEIDHIVVKVNGQNMYGDANGWQTKWQLIDSMRYFHPCVCPLGKSTVTIPLFHDLVNLVIRDYRSNSDMSFEIPDTSLILSWNPNDKGASAITSSMNTENCTGEWGGAVDAIESLVLSHFGSGVDILGESYVDGLVNSLYAIGSNIDDCKCNACG